MAGSVFTYVNDNNPQNGDAILETSQGFVKIGQSGLFLPAEVQNLTHDGAILTAGPAASPAPQLTAPVVVAGSSGSPNGVYRYVVTFVTAAGETTAGPELSGITLTNVQGSISALPLGNATSGVTARKIYRTLAAGATGTEKLVGTVADNTTTVFLDNIADGSLGANVPIIDASFVAVNLSAFGWKQG